MLGKHLKIIMNDVEINIKNIKVDINMKKYKKILNKINELEKVTEKLSDEELKKKTEEFKEKLKNGSRIEEFIAEAYAVVREAVKRVTKKRLYDVQIISGLVLNQGKIAEIKAGERKNTYCNTSSIC